MQPVNESTILNNETQIFTDDDKALINDLLNDPNFNWNQVGKGIDIDYINSNTRFQWSNKNILFAYVLYFWVKGALPVIKEHMDYFNDGCVVHLYLLERSYRLIGNALFDIVKFWSGYYSVDAFIDEMEKGSIFVDEHPYGRQNSGRHIVGYVLRHPEIKFEEFVVYIEQFCIVNRTTKQENKILEKLQKENPDWLPDQFYKSANINTMCVCEYIPENKKVRIASKKHKRDIYEKFQAKQDVNINMVTV